MLCAALALILSLVISKPYAIWDRHWHIPLVASLRGQHAPFANVYEPAKAFYYHYAGDALAAVFQSLSLAHLHASAALSRAHDVIYALTGFFLAMALRAFGIKRSALMVAVVFCTLAAGPATILLGGMNRPGGGWTSLNLLSLSFRPHEPLGYLLTCTLAATGFGALFLDNFRLRRDGLVPLALSASLLSLSDELTLLLVYGCVAAAWLFAPRTEQRGWPEKLMIFLVPPAVMVLTLGVLGGTFSPGAPKQSVELVEAHIPGFYSSSMPLRAEAALGLLLKDYLAPLAALVAGVVSAFVRRNQQGILLLIAQSALLLVSLALLLFVQVNHNDLESHRAVTGICLLAPWFVALWAARLPDGGPRAWVLGIGGLCCLTGALSTVEWACGVVRSEAPRLRTFWGPDDNFYQTDCVRDAGARLGERPVASLGPRDGWYLFAGCRPLFALLGGPPSGHAIAIGVPEVEPVAFSKLAELAGARGSVRLFYPRAAPSADVVATQIRGLAEGCRPAGKEFMECILARSDYEAWLRRRAETTPRP